MSNLSIEQKAEALTEAIVKVTKREVEQMKNLPSGDRHSAPGLLGVFLKDDQLMDMGVGTLGPQDQG